MTLGIDYSYTHPNPGAIKNAGYDFVLRYLSNDETKNISESEAQSLLQVGLGIGVIWETTAQRALQGTTAGSEDAAAANSQADALGYPLTSPIFYAVDFGASAGQITEVEDYFVGVNAGNKRPVGAYGSDGVVDALHAANLIAVAWQTEAWSGTVVSPNATLYQRVKPTQNLSGGGYDEDVEVNGKSVSFWTGTDVAKIPDPQTGGDSAPGTSSPKPTPTPSYPQFPGRLLRLIAPPYMRGEDVATFQTQLEKRTWKITPDGIFGPVTENVTKAFQADKGLTVDGIVGPQTWDAAWTTPVTH